MLVFDTPVRDRKWIFGYILAFMHSDAGATFAATINALYKAKLCFKISERMPTIE